MGEPATMIDTRFSEPGPAATRWSQTLGVLEAAELFWTTTVRADGRGLDVVVEGDAAPVTDDALLTGLAGALRSARDASSTHRTGSDGRWTHG